MLGVRRVVVLVGSCAALLVLAAACGGSDGGDRPAAASVSSPSTAVARRSTTSTTALTPEQEVEAAYLRSWDVYAKAVRTLDPSGLEESYTGDALEMVRSEIADRGEQGRPSLVRVEHNYQIKVVGDTEAGVFDSYRNHSVALDRSGAPVEDDPNEVIVEIYSMRKGEGQWKVARIARR